MDDIENKKKISGSSLAHATHMAEHWQFLGNNARASGKMDLAERHYARSQKWRDMMNDMLGRGE